MSRTDELMQPTPAHGRRAGSEVEVEPVTREAAFHGHDAELAWAIYQSGAVRRVPRRRCAADLEKERRMARRP